MIDSHAVVMYSVVCLVDRVAGITGSVYNASDY